MTNLIGLYSNSMGAGKTTVARHLYSNHDYQFVRFASPLKAMISTLIREVGYSYYEAEQYVDGPYKEVPILALDNLTPRRLMQTLGTEWGREALGEDFWVNIARARIERLLAAGRSVVVDDLRYENEALMLDGLGATIIRVDRDNAKITSAHSSEGGLSDWNPHFTLDNNGSLEGLKADIGLIAAHMKQSTELS